MTCSPKCPFFQDSSSLDWEWDSEIPNLKRRKTPAKFVCGYDGHVIVSWYSECPKREELKEND